MARKNKASRNLKGQLWKSIKIFISICASILIFATVTVPSSAAPSTSNDPETYLNENLNSTGFLTTTLGRDSVQVVGVWSVPTSLASRTIVVTLEAGRVYLRAYKPTASVSSYLPGVDWAPDPVSLQFTGNPSFNYGLDTSFNGTGIIDLGGGTGGVTKVLMHRGYTDSSFTNGDSNDVRLVLISQVQQHIKLRDLATCTNDINCVANLSRIETAVAAAGGAGAVVTGFQSDGADRIIVTGKHVTSGLPFFGKIDTSTTTGSLVDGTVVEISAADYPAGFTSAAVYTPLDNGALLYGGGISRYLLIAGNLTEGGRTVGVTFHRLFNNLISGAKKTMAIEVGGTKTELKFLQSENTMGGSYVDVDSPQEKPFLVSADFSNNTYRSLKLEVTSTSNSSLLFANRGETSTGMVAVANDGGKPRIYTWTTFVSYGAILSPSHTEIEDFDLTSETFSSAFVTDASFSNFGHSPALVLTGHSRSGGQSKLAISTFQSAPVAPVPAGLASDVTISKNTATAELVPSTFTPATQGGLSGTPNIKWYKCSAPIASPTDREATSNTVPAGCSEFGASEGAIFSISGNLRYQASTPPAVGNFLLGFSYPSFDYYTATASVISSDLTSSSDSDSSSDPITNEPIEAAFPSSKVPTFSQFAAGPLFVKPGTSAVLTGDRLECTARIEINNDATTFSHRYLENGQQQLVVSIPNGLSEGRHTMSMDSCDGQVTFVNLLAVPKSAVVFEMVTRNSIERGLALARLQSFLLTNMNDYNSVECIVNVKAPNLQTAARNLLADACNRAVTMLRTTSSTSELRNTHLPTNIWVRITLSNK